MKILRTNQYFLPTKLEQLTKKKSSNKCYQSQHNSPDVLASKSKSQLQKIQNLTMTTTDFLTVKNPNKMQNIFESEKKQFLSQLIKNNHNNDLEKQYFDESNKENRPLNGSLQKKNERIVKTNVKSKVKLMAKDLQNFTQKQQTHQQRNNLFCSQNTNLESQNNSKKTEIANKHKLSLPKKDINLGDGKKNQKKAKEYNNQKYYNLNQQLQKFQQKMTEINKQNIKKEKKSTTKQVMEQEKQDILTERIIRNSVDNIYGQFFDSKETQIKSLKNSQLPTIYCQSHPEKKAKYCTVTSANKIYYCSKCAVQKIKQGIQLQELVEINMQFNNEENLNRIEKQNQLIKFLDDIQQFDKSLINLSNLLSSRDTEINNFYSQQISKFQQFFLVLNQLIQNEQSKYIIDLKKQQEASKAEYNKTKSEIERIRREIENSRIDIETNYENILNKMDLSPFYHTINQYKEKISNYSKISETIQNKRLSLTKYTIFKTNLENFNNELTQNITQMLSNIITKQQNQAQFIKQQHHPDNKSSSLFISFANNAMIENLLGKEKLNEVVIDLIPFQLDLSTPKMLQKIKKPYNSYSLPDDKVKETLDLGYSKLQSSKFLSVVNKDERQTSEKLEIQELNANSDNIIDNININVQESIEFKKHCIPKNNFTFSKADNISSKLMESLTSNQIKQSIDNYKKLNLECGLVVFEEDKPNDSTQTLRIADVDSPHFKQSNKRLEF